MKTEEIKRMQNCQRYLRGEQMSDLTREQAIINLEIIREEMYDEEYGEQTQDSIEFQESLDMAISALSTEEDNTMEWIFDENETCSRCGYVVEGDHDTEFKFCPNCGRKAVQK